MSFKHKILSLIPLSVKKSEFFNRVIKYYEVFKYRTLLKNSPIHYESVIKNFKTQKRKIRFGVYIAYDSMFGGKKFCEIIKNDAAFEYVKFVIVPNTMRPKEQMIEVYNKTKEFFINHYGNENIIDGYNEKTGEFYDRSDMFDVVYVASPYELDKHKFHSLTYLSQQNLLPFYIQYAFSHFKYGDHVIAAVPGISFLWRVFLNNKFEYEGAKKFSLSSAKNAKISGYAKMDDFANLQKKDSDKKQIIIAPHHSVKSQMLQISNFLYYSDLILELPKMFPKVDFIFRPHPHLFINLKNYGFWNDEKIKKYQSDIKSCMEYSTGGDYLEIFANADGIIHDCGSFISEWLYSGKKGCFVSFDGAVFNQLSKFGKEALKFYDIAKNRDDIINYIKNVENDKFINLDLKEVGENIMVNYPNASNFIVDEIKKTLKC